MDAAVRVGKRSAWPPSVMCSALAEGVREVGSLKFTANVLLKSSSVVPARSLFGITPEFRTKVSILPTRRYC